MNLRLYMNLRLLLGLVPWGLVIVRLALGPVLLWLARDGWVGWPFALAVIVAFVSDVLDGVIARQLKVATPRLRESDSWTDAIFCACVAGAICLAYRAAVMALWPLVTLWLTTEVFALAFEWFKFRRFGAYHAFSAKLGGSGLFVGVIALFLSGDHRLLGLGLLLASLGHLERIVLTWLLPRWTPDVLSVWHARKLMRTRADKVFEP